MKTAEFQVNEEWLRELLEVLDGEQARIEHTLAELDRLRAAIIRRDEAELNGLLRDVQDRHADYAQLDRRREDLRCRLAGQIGVEVERMNLTRLVRGLAPGWKETIRARQDRLGGLSGLLRMEYRLTALLLADCSRLNRALLRAIVGGGEATVYNSQGRSNWELQDRLVSVRM